MYKRVLICASHPDDIELGLGGLLSRFDGGYVFIASDSLTINTDSDMIQEVENSLQNLFDFHIIIGKWETMYLWKSFQEIRNRIFQLKQNLNPDIVFSTSINSLHPDHKAVAEACNSIFSDTTLYSFEPIRSNQLFKPNKWVEISKKELDLKIKAISMYSSQKGKTYFDPEAIIAQARFYGSQIGKPFAEALEVVREVEYLI